jgi:predicted SnoaL-like aldol condensation-catalyzing enzyme
MSAKSYKDKYLHYINSVNRHDVDEADRLTDEMMAEDCIWHWPGWTGSEPQMGTAGQKAFICELIANNPDLRIAVDDLCTDEDRMFLRGAMFTNNPSTGAVEQTAFLEIDRIVDGKMVESWTLSAPGSW